MAALTPAQIAVLDQEQAELGDHLDLLIRMYEEGMRGESPPVQIVADITVWLPTRYTELSVRALLATALGRLAKSGA